MSFKVTVVKQDLCVFCFFFACLFLNCPEIEVCSYPRSQYSEIKSITKECKFLASVKNLGCPLYTSEHELQRSWQRCSYGSHSPTFSHQLNFFSFPQHSGTGSCENNCYSSKNCSIFENKGTENERIGAYSLHFTLNRFFHMLLSMCSFNSTVEVI